MTAAHVTLSDQTEDAYSFGLYYSKREWTRITRWLLNWAYVADEVEWILRSKHMRWANDSCNDGGRMTLEKFQEYCRTNRRAIHDGLEHDLKGGLTDYKGAR